MWALMFPPHTGAAPNPSDSPYDAPQQPAVTVQYALYQLPASTDSGKYTEYTEQPHFVLQRTDSAPILLSSCILDLPAQCTAPVVTIGVWLCDTLPDVSLFRGGIDSAAQFFAANWPYGTYNSIFFNC